MRAPKLTLADGCNVLRVYYVKLGFGYTASSTALRFCMEVALHGQSRLAQRRATALTGSFRNGVKAIFTYGSAGRNEDQLDAVEWRHHLPLSKTKRSEKGATFCFTGP